MQGAELWPRKVQHFQAEGIHHGVLHGVRDHNGEVEQGLQGLLVHLKAVLGKEGQEYCWCLVTKGAIRRGYMIRAYKTLGVGLEKLVKMLVMGFKMLGRKHA